jgi:hypothetical protein
LIWEVFCFLSWLSRNTPVFTHWYSVADSEEHFLLFSYAPSISHNLKTQLPMAARLIHVTVGDPRSTSQEQLKARWMHFILITTQPIACFELHVEVNWSVQRIDGVETIDYWCADGRFSQSARGRTLLNDRSVLSSGTEERNTMKTWEAQALSSAERQEAIGGLQFSN